MFEVNKTTPHVYRYDFEWLKKGSDLNGYIKSWISKLKNISYLDQIANRFGQGHVHRRQLAKEFHEVLFCYAQFLDERSEKFRGRMIPPEISNALTAASMRVDNAIKCLEKTYTQNFDEDILTNQQLGRLTQNANAIDLASVLDNPSTQLAIIDRKIQLVQYWKESCDGRYQETEFESRLMAQASESDADEYDTGIFLIFLHQASNGKLRAVLDVLLKDAAECMKYPAKFTGESIVGTASEAPKVEWNVQKFKTTVKAEAGAFRGVKRTGKCEIEVKGLRAEFKAEVMAGAAAAAKVEASWGRDGIEAKAEISAEVGIKITLSAEVECGDIFMLNASAEAFAGAMAKATVEFSANVNGVKFKIEAEAFAGARITGNATVGLKFFGNEILSIKAEGSLSAGVGAKFKLDFASEGAGGHKFGVAAGLTLGLGAEGEVEVEWNSWSTMTTVMYMVYTYNKTVEDERIFPSKWYGHLPGNERMLDWSLEILEAHRLQAQGVYDTACLNVAELATIKKHADAFWKPNKGQKISADKIRY